MPGKIYREVPEGKAKKSPLSMDGHGRGHLTEKKEGLRMNKEEVERSLQELRDKREELEAGITNLKTQILQSKKLLGEDKEDMIDRLESLSEVTPLDES